ncbi:hypothetical protein SASPL_107675 [Salvia splendens]|uniref:GAG-pre-integrase domain-containing protein n=1 Tax=Salvia splendens TaxID=180675 RepID=A0A8X8YBQ6_SALSN|nr:hypothetical protein SASPL_107675 [Salvia splendens]
MCPIREWFFDFEELNGGLVYMGNDSPCKTAGIGSIKLRNQDGSTRILKDVRILKATSGALVMLKGVSKNNLYYYQGSTVVGTVATATSSNKKDAEATKLWHLRLGHAGERSLQILAKQGLLKTPLEVWSSKPATDYDSLHIFGSIAYYHVTESKLDPRAKKALFMGFSAGVKGYRLWCLESKKTIVSRDVTFDESSMLNKVNPNSSDTLQQMEYTPKQVEFEEAVVIPTTNTTNDSPMEEEESDDEEVPPQEPSQQSEPIAVRRTRRENKKPARFADMVAYALPVVDDVFDDLPERMVDVPLTMSALPQRGSTMCFSVGASSSPPWRAPNASQIEAFGIMEAGIDDMFGKKLAETGFRSTEDEFHYWKLRSSLIRLLIITSIPFHSLINLCDMASSSNSSWADQWDTQSQPVSTYTTFSHSGSSTSSKLDKTKAVASSGIKKVKAGATAGLHWMKNKYHKATTHKQ